MACYINKKRRSKPEHNRVPLRFLAWKCFHSNKVMGREVGFKITWWMHECQTWE